MVEIPEAPILVAHFGDGHGSLYRWAGQVAEWMEQVREALAKAPESVQEPRRAAAGVTGPEKGAETGREALVALTDSSASWVEHRHSWELWRTRVMAFGRVGLPGKYPRCSMCGEYEPRFLG